MRNDPEGRFEAAVVAYGLGDLELAARFFAANCFFATCIPAETLPFGGAVVGVPAILDRWKLVARDFELTAYKPRAVMITGETIRTQIEYAFLHRASGEEIDGVMRIEAEFEFDKIAVWREYHDGDRIKAFMRLCTAKLAARLPIAERADS